MTSGRFYNLIFLKVVAVPCKRVVVYPAGLLKIQQNFEENELGDNAAVAKLMKNYAKSNS